MKQSRCSRPTPCRGRAPCLGPGSGLNGEGRAGQGIPAEPRGPWQRCPAWVRHLPSQARVTTSVTLKPANSCAPPPALGVDGDDGVGVPPRVGDGASARHAGPDLAAGGGGDDDGDGGCGAASRRASLAFSTWPSDSETTPEHAPPSGRSAGPAPRGRTRPGSGSCGRPAPARPAARC